MVFVCVFGRRDLHVCWSGFQILTSIRANPDPLPHHKGSHQNRYGYNKRYDKTEYAINTGNNQGRFSAD
jgi:hypothetical protein